MTPFAWYLLALTVVAVLALVAQTIRLELVRDELNGERALNACREVSGA